MSDIDHAFAAPLLRGLYVDAFGRGIFLKATELAEVPRDALIVELSGDAAIAEETTAASFAEALASWRAPRGKAVAAMPGCVFLRSGDASVTYWPGLGYDEARHRAERRDVSSLLVPPHGADTGGSSRMRSEVVVLPASM